jgi:hypothetical protein
MLISTISLSKWETCQVKHHLEDKHFPKISPLPIVKKIIGETLGKRHSETGLLLISDVR